MTPLLVDLAGRRVVVVGGGAVAVRRVTAMLEAGADVLLVAPSVDPAMPAVTVHRRSYQLGDLAGAWLVHACTDDPAVNAQVAAEAERLRIWCVRADADGDGSAQTCTATTADGMTVAVHGGGDPRRAVALRAAISAALATGELLPRRGRRRGSVALVGGGPGRPDLITVRGRQLLADADVVVVDALAPRGLLADLPPDVEVIDAGKAPHRHNLTQAEINALLVERALRGQAVVRLKGGDPFVFGRGGEEALACVAAGVPFEVVPGVTSAVAVPALAGIPVTHRGVTQDFAVVSGHLDPSHPGATVDWEALASGPRTLVLLMAVASIESIAGELVKRGRDARTPVAVISGGTTANERVLVTDLASVAGEIAAAGVSAPAVIVVGEVVRLRDQLQSHGVGC